MPSRCAFGCNPRGRTMHRFPNPKKYPDRFRAWVEVLVGKLDDSKNYLHFRQKRICDIHFLIEHHNRNNRVSALSIPVLHLSGDSTRSGPSEAKRICKSPKIENQFEEIDSHTSIDSQNFIDNSDFNEFDDKQMDVNPFVINIELNNTNIEDINNEEAYNVDTVDLSCEDNSINDEEDVEFLNEFKSNNNTILHSDFACNVCQGDILGFRYTCMQCADWDMCAACEARGEHPAHYVLRLPAPRPYTEIEPVLTAVREHIQLLLDHDDHEIYLKQEEIDRTQEDIAQDMIDSFSVMNDRNVPEVNFYQKNNPEDISNSSQTGDISMDTFPKNDYEHFSSFNKKRQKPLHLRKSVLAQKLLSDSNLLPSQKTKNNPVINKIKELKAANLVKKLKVDLHEDTTHKDFESPLFNKSRVKKKVNTLRKQFIESPVFPKQKSIDLSLFKTRERRNIEILVQKPSEFVVAPMRTYSKPSLFEKSTAEKLAELGQKPISELMNVPKREIVDPSLFNLSDAQKSEDQVQKPLSDLMFVNSHKVTASSKLPNTDNIVQIPINDSTLVPNPKAISLRNKKVIVLNKRSLQPIDPKLLLKRTAEINNTS